MAAHRWLGKTAAITCPHCQVPINLGYNGTLKGNFLVLDSALIDVSESAPNKRSLAMKKVRPGYQKDLDAMQVGDFLIIEPKRLMWFGWSCGPWLRRHPNVQFHEEWLPNGGKKITRTL